MNRVVGINPLRIGSIIHMPEDLAIFFRPSETLEAMRDEHCKNDNHQDCGFGGTVKRSLQPGTRFFSLRRPLLFLSTLRNSSMLPRIFPTSILRKVYNGVMPCYFDLVGREKSDCEKHLGPHRKYSINRD